MAPTTKARLGNAAAILVILLVTSGLCWLFAPSLYKDWRMHGNTSPAPSAQVIDGDCKRRALVVTYCNAKLAIAVGDTISQTNVTNLFIGMPGEQFRLEIIQDNGAPARLSTTLGQEKLLNRSITFVGFVGLMLMLIFLGIGKFFRG